MRAGGRAKLALVPNAPSSPQDLLTELVPELIEAEAVAARLKRLIAEQGRALAKSRGVAFIREEAIRREFGND